MATLQLRQDIHQKSSTRRVGPRDLLGDYQETFCQQPASDSVVCNWAVERTLLTPASTQKVSIASYGQMTLP
jgi:hypothetical protein